MEIQIDAHTAQPTHDPAIAAQALRVIEGLTFEDIIGEPEKKLEEIYKFAHIANGHCENPHPEWRRQLQDAENALVKMGIYNLCEDELHNAPREKWGGVRWRSKRQSGSLRSG